MTDPAVELVDDRVWKQAAWCASPDGVRSGLSWVEEDPAVCARAKAACRRHCAVIEDCLASALRDEAPFGASGRGGVWGGLGPSEREETSRLIDEQRRRTRQRGRQTGGAA